MRSEPAAPSASEDTLHDGVPPALCAVVAAAVLTAAAAWGSGLSTLMVCVWAIGAAVFQGLVFASWRRSLQYSLLAPLRSTIRAMRRLRATTPSPRASGEDVAEHARACLAMGGGPLARSLTRHWNEVAARTVEIEREAAARVSAVESSRDRLRAVLDTITEGVLVIGPAGEMALANPAARAMLGLGDRNLAGRRLDEVTDGDLRERLRDALEVVADTAVGRHDVEGVLHRNRVLDVTALRARTGADGAASVPAFPGVVVVLADVTRHGEIRRVKDKFLSSMSHELRTPLTSICSYAELMQSMVPGQDAEWPEFLRIIHQEGQRLAGLVDTLLDYVRMEAEEVLWQRRTLDLCEVAERVCSELQPAAAAKDLTLELDRDARPCPVVGDEKGLARAIRLLVDNGLKFVPAGGRIVVTVGRDGRRVRLRVEDDGVGIPAHLRDEAFERFHQPRDHLTEKPEGLGLGLPTCRLIVSQHGGEVWCDQGGMGGARLQFVLPLAPAGSAEAAVPAALQAGAGVRNPPGAPAPAGDAS